MLTEWLTTLFSKHSSEPMKNSTAEPHRGIPLRDLLHLSNELGCSVEHCRRTGEIKVHHPSFGKVIKLNMRRNDSPRVLVSKIRQLMREQRANV